MLNNNKTFNVGTEARRLPTRGAGRVRNVFVSRNPTRSER
jgi:hypothetical protein